NSCYRYFIAGICLLVIYGFYKVLYYRLTGTSGDFLTNRTFNEGYSASSTHVMEILGVATLRMKSLTGEASMFAFTVLPYWVFAIHKKRMVTAGILTLALFPPPSTSPLPR